MPHENPALETRLQQAGLAFAIILLIAGIALFWTGFQMPRYHDEKEYFRRYSDLAFGNSPTRSSDFYALRAQSLTASYSRQNYGLTCVLLGIVLIPVSQWRKVRRFLPSQKWTLALLGGLAAFLVMQAEVFSLYSDAFRGEFPSWADSLAIPLAGIPAIFVVLGIWAAVHALLTPAAQGNFERLTFTPLNCWLVLLITITTAYLLTAIVVGYFWQIIPAALWITFYLSIWMKRSETAPSSLE